MFCTELLFRPVVLEKGFVVEERLEIILAPGFEGLSNF